MAIVGVIGIHVCLGLLGGKVVSGVNLARRIEQLQH